MKVVKMNNERTVFVNNAREFLKDENRSEITRAEVMAVVSEYEMKRPSWLLKLKTGKRGCYFLPTTDGRYGNEKTTVPTTNKEEVSSVVAMVSKGIEVLEEQDSYVPEKFPGYVAWGNFNTLKKVIKSEIFYPIFITGMSGNGKTLMVKETCARLNREFVRANITIETDEDDLIGGFRLVNGETVWHDGPVIMAMKRGAILLLDEIALASNKIMALQPILEGSSIYVKKIGKWVHPAAGFNVIATANTKGQGSDDGRFIGTNVMN